MVLTVESVTYSEEKGTVSGYAEGPRETIWPLPEAWDKVPVEFRNSLP